MEQWRKNLYTMMTTQICCMIGFGLVSPFIAFYFQEMGMKMGAELDLAVSLDEPQLRRRISALYQRIYPAVFRKLYLRMK